MTIATPTHWTDPVKTSILSISQESVNALSPEDRSNLDQFEDYAKRYAHRIACPLSSVTFMTAIKPRLEAEKIGFARLPIKSIDTVYYLFKDLRGVQILAEILTPMQRPAGAALN